MRKTKLIFSFICLVFGWMTFSGPQPPGSIAPYLDGAFPSRAPGIQGSWSLENVLEGMEIMAPIRIISYPRDNKMLVSSKSGLVHLLDTELKELTQILDIEDRVFKLADAGFVGMALHPDFDPDDPEADKRIFVYYKTSPTPEEWSDDGYNRLSSFVWNNDLGEFDNSTEQILIQQYDRSPWHDGGAMFFGPEDGFLYLSIGDEGFEEHQEVSTQRLDRGLFSGILRLDVDNDPSLSHPIRRQPIANGPMHPNWSTYSQGYSIPNDNPWLNEDGSILEEFYAIGIRSPFAMSYDEEKQQIWLADVGSDMFEEVNLIEGSDNCQWPYMEGEAITGYLEKPSDSDFIGFEKEVLYAVPRDAGACIIGGQVYNSTEFSYLNGKYLFADHITHKLMALNVSGGNSEPEMEVLIPNVRSLPVDLPEKGGITGVHVMPNGEVWLGFMGEDFSKPGRLLKLIQNTAVEEPPARLSELNVFEDLQTLEVRKGIIPYDVNVPLYSDGAIKRRWMAVPNDGVFDEASEQVKFSERDEWVFPEGTVFIKHFDLPQSEDAADVSRLETRFLIMGEGGKAYGLTYKWNEEGTEAFLLGGGSSRNVDISEEGEFQYTQRWDFPSRDQCLTCHNDNAKYVLGVKTHQMNKDVYNDDIGASINQLEYLNGLGFFQSSLRPSSSYLKASLIDSDERDLHWRIRSYLDANCASCHRLGGVQDVLLDFRLGRSAGLQEYFNLPTGSHASSGNDPIIYPGDHAQSELWIRDASNETNQMPPLGRTMVDQQYVDSLAVWIDSVEEEDLVIDHELLIYPNPTVDWVILRVNTDAEPPYKLRVMTSSGRIVMQSNLESRTVPIDLGSYPKGTYFVDLEFEDKREVRKVILQ